MRLVSLARVAAEAEGVRLRKMARRQALRGVWAIVAALFVLFFVVMLHLTIYEFLVPALRPRYAALILLGIDLLFALVFGLMASRSSPGLEEREAALISLQARAELSDSMTRAALVTPVARIVGGGGLRRAVVTASLTELLARFRTKKRQKLQTTR